MVEDQVLVQGTGLGEDLVVIVAFQEIHESGEQPKHFFNLDVLCGCFIKFAGYNSGRFKKYLTD